jgi:hypothetical protein
MIDSTARISGVSLPESGFRVHETYKTVDVSKVYDVLSGKLAAYRVRDYCPKDACDKIVENFWASPKKTPRYGEGEDGVEGYFIGASHIEKTTEEYLQEAESYAEGVRNLFTGTINPLAEFREELILKGDRYTAVRPAQHMGMIASDSKAVYWNNMGDFLLRPHDDIAQVKDPRQHDFEIQQASRVMAINFYAAVPENAGQLKIWNIEADNRSRADLGLTYSGYPYPEEYLEDFESITISVEPGEICVINGNLIHAVIRGDSKAVSKCRLLLSCFMTFNEKRELIWWT